MEYLNEIREMSPTVRVKWVYDTTYETRGSYSYDTPKETKAAEDYELDMLERGVWVVLGAIVQHKCEHCGEWKDGDSLWGIVIEDDGAKLDEFARHSLDLEPPK